jgi:hypothetical protein
MRWACGVGDWWRGLGGSRIKQEAALVLLALALVVGRGGAAAVPLSFTLAMGEERGLGKSNGD